MLAEVLRYTENPIESVISGSSNTFNWIFFFLLNTFHNFSQRFIPNSLNVWTHKFFQNLLISILSVGPVPEHVSFIMDGNRRYAKSNNLPLKRGHEAGGFTLLTLVYICKKIGVRCVSAYAFSIENFSRPKEEVSTLMELFSNKLEEFATRANDFKDPLYGSRLKIIGDRRLLTKQLRKKVEEVERFTTDGTDFTFYVCFPYTSRNDIQHAMYLNSKSYLKNKIKLKDINMSNFSRNMYLENFSDKCDILIRTSGHKRLSDYMLWQSHQNTTIEFVNTLWPDFSFIQMYLIFFRWSFFTTIQQYNSSGSSALPNLVPNFQFFNNKKYEPLETFPESPIAVSILGN